MGFLPKHALDNLKSYKYSGVDKSLLSRYILNPFWNWFVTLWPLSVAPNTITLSGLAIVFVNFLTMLYYDPAYLAERGGAKVPTFIYYTWGIGLFLYQSFDAVDGKQARRTGMAGPLGEMFDHGCDAINTTLEVIIAAQALNLGRSWWTVASQLASLANFYLTTWEEYHTGQLYLGVFSGPVEGILMVVAIYLITGLYGPSFWNQKILDITHLNRYNVVDRYVPDIALNESFMVIGAFGLAYNIFSSFMNVRRATHAAGKSTIRPLAYLLPFVIPALLQVIWLAQPHFNESNILQSAAFVPFLCAWGLQFAHQVGRMILAHVTRTEFPLWDWMWIWSLLGAIDANLPRMFGRPPIIQANLEQTAIFLYVTLAISSVAYFRFCTLVIKDITEYLGIACFRVQKRDQEGVWKDPKSLSDADQKRKN